MRFKTTITLRSVFFAIGGLLLYIVVSLTTGSFCWFQSVLGVPCPACGSLRAVQALIRGQFALAHYYHPLIILSLFICLYFFIKYLYFKTVCKIEEYILIGIVIIYIVVFIIRMFFLFPHSEPLVPSETSLLRLLLCLIY